MNRRFVEEPAASPAAATRLAPQALGALNEAMDRLEAAVAQESAFLRGGRVADLAEFNQRKRQGLLEIDRLLRPCGAPQRDLGAISGVDGARIRRLAAGLEDNRQLLACHLKAVEAIAGLLSRAMREAESDGTYGCFGA